MGLDFFGLDFWGLGAKATVALRELYHPRPVEGVSSPQNASGAKGAV